MRKIVIAFVLALLTVLVFALSACSQQTPEEMMQNTIEALQDYESKHDAYEKAYSDYRDGELKSSSEEFFFLQHDSNAKLKDEMDKAEDKVNELMGKMNKEFEKTQVPFLKTYLESHTWEEAFRLLADLEPYTSARNMLCSVDNFYETQLKYIVDANEFERVYINEETKGDYYEKNPDAMPVPEARHSTGDIIDGMESEVRRTTVQHYGDFAVAVENISSPLLRSIGDSSGDGTRRELYFKGNLLFCIENTAAVNDNVINDEGEIEDALYLYDSYLISIHNKMLEVLDYSTGEQVY